MEREDDGTGEPSPSRREARRARREAERAASGGTAERGGRDRGDEAADARPQRVGPVQYVGEVRSELRKVAWPSRREVLGYSAAVLVMTAVLSALIFGMDWVIRNLTVQIFG